MTAIPVRVEDLRPDDLEGFDQTVRVLIDAFAPIGWPDDLEEARREVRESLEPDRISLVARDESGTVIGWIGGLHEYARVWELHPLAVAPGHQRGGLGRALVATLEERVAARGGLTLRLGTDDVHLVDTGKGRTSLADVDLYIDPLKHLSTIRNLGGHPYEFYLACGYAIVGVMPDANGIGEPDIFMAKRIAP
jgi:aminoglycoside 6'-N-acetyltransferase I